MTKDEEKYTDLDTEQCKWWVNHLFSIAKEQACNSHNFNDAEEMQSAQDKIIKALEQEPIIYKIRAEIIMYEGDCRLSVDEYPSCKQCTDNVFETIYGILDKYKTESEDK